MNETTLTVTENIVVRLAFVLRLNNGEEIDRADIDTPFEYIHGHRQIIPGMEKELAGMEIGDVKEFTVAPIDAYGIYKAEEVVEIPKENFPIYVKAEIGKPLEVKDHQSGQSFRAYIKDIRPDTVVLDFNHPLAGKKLFFNVEILDLRTAAPEEISHRHSAQD